MAMTCVYCGSKTSVTNSRLQKRPNHVWRRRHCKYCGATFTSVESPSYTHSITFHGNTGHTEPFSRDKLYLSIYEACKHRKDAVEASASLTDTVIDKLLPTLHEATVKRGDVVLITQQVLKRFDHLAAGNYTAYHAKTS